MRKLHMLLIEDVTCKRTSTSSSCNAFPGFFVNASHDAPCRAGNNDQLPWGECVSPAWLTTQSAYQEADFPPAPPAVLAALNLDIPDILFSEADPE